MRLEPLELWLERGPGPLRPQILAALRQHGEPLRWAITAVEPSSPEPGGVDGPQEALSALASDPGAMGAPSAARSTGVDALGDPDGLAPSDRHRLGPGRLRLEAVMLR